MAFFLTAKNADCFCILNNFSWWIIPPSSLPGNADGGLVCWKLGWPNFEKWVCKIYTAGKDYTPNKQRASGLDLLAI